MLGKFKYLSSIGPHALKDAIPIQETMVEDRDFSVFLGNKLAVDVDEHSVIS
jgi:hypothetical protein